MKHAYTCILVFALAGAHGLCSSKAESAPSENGQRVARSVYLAVLGFGVPSGDRSSSSLPVIIQLFQSSPGSYETRFLTC